MTVKEVRAQYHVDISLAAHFALTRPPFVKMRRAPDKWQGWSRITTVASSCLAAVRQLDPAAVMAAQEGFTLQLFCKRGGCRRPVTRGSKTPLTPTVASDRPPISALENTMRGRGWQSRYLATSCDGLAWTRVSEPTQVEELQVLLSEAFKLS